MQVRIATFNALHGIRLSAGRTDDGLLGRVAAQIGAHILAVQEIDRGQERSGGSDQVALIARGVGARAWRFVATVDGTPGSRRAWTAATNTGLTDDGIGPQYGIGLVSTLPVRSWQVLRLRAAPFGMPLAVSGPTGTRLIYVADEPRVALAAVVELPGGGVVTVVSTHLSFVPGWNVWQLRAIHRWARNLPRPLVLAGDLNLPGGLGAAVTGWRDLVRAASYPSPEPRVQLDHLLADADSGAGAGASSGRRFTVTGSGARLMEISDHLALWADLELTS